MLAWGGSTLPAFASDSTALHEAYADDFLIGTIIPGGLDPQATFSDDPVELGVMTREFNALTAENCMKPMFMQPHEGEFFFKASDYCVDFAEANSMELVGHTLVWHAMTADWIFQGGEGQAASREQLIERMRTHIHTVMSRYKGRIKYWDVLNEAVVMQGEHRPAKLRPSPWLKIIGVDYIEMAFRFAHEADPEAKLYYNDYNMTKRPKVDFVLAMVQDLRAKGVPIHGVGLQGHWSLDWPSISEIEYTLQAFAEASIPVSITELDISVLPVAESHSGADVEDNIEFAEKYNPYADSIPCAVLDAQATRYAEIFELFLKYREHIERVSFWGTSDVQSWKNEYPMKGRTDYPLLFDRSYQAKPAYDAIIQLPNNEG
ncbi:MAG: endo-1,4-beta-xylanase [Puniceicoccaceae bacterium]|nr:endo-1,4-beta-xylanase [Puniceicoccaceae bacterium]